VTRRPQPHLVRMWVILALCGAFVVTAVLLVSSLIGLSKLPADNYPTTPEPTRVFMTPEVNR
jgi:hypothetical protein